MGAGIELLAGELVKRDAKIEKLEAEIARLRVALRTLATFSTYNTMHDVREFARTELERKP